ncbi:MAG: hypothetical protein MUC58_08210 [Rhizobiaceae bacterium]|jgi:hypothetical protein|nr:hypothetical protein [Rhizobiaceae bacterium]
MANDFDADGGSTIDLLRNAGSGALRVALLFGSAAVALTMILTPIANRQVAGVSGIDPIATGSTRSVADPVTRTYVLRRSVLQNHGEVCIINANGMRAGSC